MGTVQEFFEKTGIKGNTITKENVVDFIQKFEVRQFGDKTTVVKATLINGFIIVESSSCVHPDNFDMMVGQKICEERIRNKVWELLGFILQTFSPKE